MYGRVRSRGRSRRVSACAPSPRFEVGDLLGCQSVGQIAPGGHPDKMTGRNWPRFRSGCRLSRRSPSARRGQLGGDSQCGGVNRTSPTGRTYTTRLASHPRSELPPRGGLASSPIRGHLLLVLVLRNPFACFAGFSFGERPALPGPQKAEELAELRDVFGATPWPARRRGCRGMTAIGWCGRWNIAATVPTDPANPWGTWPHPA